MTKSSAAIPQEARWLPVEDWGWQLDLPGNDGCIACYYDERPEQYAIFAYGGPLETIWPHTTLPLRKTPEHDACIIAIVVALRHLACRQAEEFA